MPPRTDRLPCASTRAIAVGLALAAALAGCASRRGSPDNEPTLKSLAGREVPVAADQRIAGGEAQAIAAYQRFLAATPAAPQRAAVMRRLGDLEMASADQRLAAEPAREPASAAGGRSAATADYRAAIAHYREVLAAYPNAEGNNRVLYQLARAQEQSGEPEAALKTLDRLVAEHPNTAHRAEAQFRRGELLFTARRYPAAEAAYADVLAAADGFALRGRALYMQGWSRFKQGRLEEGLAAFFAVLDTELADAGADDEALVNLPRARRELVEDSFRVVSISLSNLQGAASIEAYAGTPSRRDWEHRVYAQLAELYVKQGRVKDAADTFGAFVKRHPQHVQAPVLQSRAIEIYEHEGFAGPALEAKREFVSRYGLDGAFRAANPDAWARARPLVKTHLAALARHHHAHAQKLKSAAEADAAVRWYRALLDAFPDEADTAQNRFLLAELLFENRRHAEAAAAYETVAYAGAPQTRSADAGYAALLAHAELARAAAGPEGRMPQATAPPGPGVAAMPTAGAEPARAPGADRAALERAAVASALRFADRFSADARTATVLADAADRLHALRDTGEAVSVARRVLALSPAAAPAQRRTAWTIVAQAAFEAADFAGAEQGCNEALALLPPNDAARGELTERLAASVYKQGEAARTAGREREAVGHFERVGLAAPASAVRATAQYDAAAALINLKDWPAAARALEDFRRRWPGHGLQTEVTTKLAAVYLESGQVGEAAGEFERLASVQISTQTSTQADPSLARASLWQAAELYDKAGRRPAAAQAFERYLKQHPEPAEAAIEARWRLALLARADGAAPRELGWMKDVVAADQRAGSQRTPRTRALAAQATLALAQPAFEAYRQVALVEPLDKQLKTKKARMEAVLKAYAAASESGVAEVVTAATFHTAALYQDFGRALMDSQRPKRLSKAEREQYEVMLEEQAFPFEEKAIALHEANAKRAAQGVYDAWVQRSFASLAALRPARWGKAERADAGVDAAQPGAQEAAQARAHRDADRGADAVAALEAAVRAGPRHAPHWNQLGIASRAQGRFDRAREAYARAIELDAQYAAPLLNLAILHDLYLGDAPAALALYDRYLERFPTEGAAVAKWVADLKNRRPAKTAGADTVARKEP